MTVSRPAARCCVPHSTSSLYLQGRPSLKDEKTFPIRLTHQTTEQLYSSLDYSSQPFETNLEHFHPLFEVNSRHIHIHPIPYSSILSLTLLLILKNAVRVGLPVRHGRLLQPLQSAHVLPFHHHKLLLRLISLRPIHSYISTINTS